jgi:protein-S-isoprenylcysteine O-methyltransferase Ste14
MPYVIGSVLSAAVALFARKVGLDRDRAFYPTVMIVIASYYVLFAAMSGSVQTVVIESVVTMLFAAAAVAGFKSSPWIVVVALAGHGVFDAVHGHVIENAGVPTWWPAWCLAYDVGAAAGLAWLLRREVMTNDVRA